MESINRGFGLLLGLFVLLFSVLLSPQLNLASAQGKEVDMVVLGADLEFRCIGPFRGGRSAAVTGVQGKPMLFYMGATGGGVWKTENGGSTWKNISDGYFGG